MRTLLIVLLAAIAAPPGPSLAGASVDPADPQYIYCAERAEECFLYCLSHTACPRPDTMYLFIRANDPIGVSRAHFHLEVEYPCCDSIETIIPRPGVTIESGSLMQGMTIAFPPQQSGHFEALAFVIRHDSRNPPFAYSDYGFLVRDAWLERADAVTIPVSNHRTMPFYPDCYNSWPLWYHPDTVNVHIGSRTNVKIRWSLEGPYPGMGGWPVSISDNGGWIGDTTFDSMWCTGCLTCAWHVETDYVSIDVPEGTPVGTLSTLSWSIWTGRYHDSLILRAVPPIGTEKRSWGTMKDFFK